MKFVDFYNDIVRRILGRDLVTQDGIAVAKIEATEARLGFRITGSLREYYRVAGNLYAINESHNRLLKVEELRIEGDYLIFMEENQWVTWWGVKLADLMADDSEVWQGINETPIEWYSEEMPVSQFLSAMFLWTFGLEEEPKYS